MGKKPLVKFSHDLNGPNHLHDEVPHFGRLEYCKVFLPYGIPSLFMRLLNVFG
jgi:hypothetical protein